MILIPDWKRGWRMLSVQVSALAAALWSAWLLLPPDQQTAIATMLGVDPAKAGPLLAFLGIIIARLKAQRGLTTAQSPAPAPAPPAN